MGVTDMLRGGCPVLRDDQPQDSSCSTDETSKSESINPNNQMLLQEKQSATIGQSKPLATDREVSTIPKSEFTPSHQNEGLSLSFWNYVCKYIYLFIFFLFLFFFRHTEMDFTFSFPVYRIQHRRPRPLRLCLFN